MPEHQGTPMTPKLLRIVMVNCINRTYEGKMDPQVCIALAAAAQAFTDLYRLEGLEEKIAGLERQLLVQSSNMNA